LKFPFLFVGERLPTNVKVNPLGDYIESVPTDSKRNIPMYSLTGSTVDISIPYVDGVLVELR
jgi:hypothetical protein